MAEPEPVIPNDSWVLVTGANGFLGSHVVRLFLQRGYKVRGTVRNIYKSSWLLQDVFKSHYEAGLFELVEVPDLGAKGAFTEAVRGMSAVVHVATIVTFDADPHKVIPQTVDGTLSIMHAALEESEVKAFVYTSSIVASSRFIPGDSTHVERDTWNEEAIELAWAPPPYNPTRAKIVYDASKTEAEKAVWKFVKEKRPYFNVNCVNPACLIGEALNRKHQETAYSMLKLLYDGNTAFLDPGCKSLFPVGIAASTCSPYHGSPRFSLT